MRLVQAAGTATARRYSMMGRGPIFATVRNVSSRPISIRALPLRSRIRKTPMDRTTVSIACEFRQTLTPQWLARQLLRMMCATGIRLRRLGPLPVAAQQSMELPVSAVLLQTAVHNAPMMPPLNVRMHYRRFDYVIQISLKSF